MIIKEYMDIWKTSSIILIVLILGLSIVVLTNQNEDMDIQGLTIDKENFGILNEVTPGGQYALCSISQNKCIGMTKQKLG